MTRIGRPPAHTPPPPECSGTLTPIAVPVLRHGMSPSPPDDRVRPPSVAPSIPVPSRSTRAEYLRAAAADPHNGNTPARTRQIRATRATPPALPAIRHSIRPPPVRPGVAPPPPARRTRHARVHHAPRFGAHLP